VLRSHECFHIHLHIRQPFEPIIVAGASERVPSSETEAEMKTASLYLRRVTLVSRRSLLTPGSVATRIVPSSCSTDLIRFGTRLAAATRTDIGGQQAPGGSAIPVCALLFAASTSPRPRISIPPGKAPGHADQAPSFSPR